MPLEILLAVGFGCAIASVGAYHFFFVRPRFRVLDALTTAAGDEVGKASIAGIARLLTEQGGTIDALRNQLASLESTLRQDVFRVGFLRYNSFTDVGSDLSFSVAFVNGEGDGVILTSIYSREETRTYGKSVRKFVPQQGASDEELQAMTLARRAAHDK